MRNNTGTISRIAFVLLAASLIFGRFLLPRWLTYDHLSIISWDVFGYYLYLPAQFIYQDIGITDFSWLQQILDQYKPTIGFYQAYPGPAGEYIMKYPMGMAIVFAPFFFLAHLLAGPLGYAADGFSWPYQFFLAMGCLLIAITGLWFLRKILLRFFSDKVTALVMVLLVWGTNYFQLSVYDSAMVHNALFTVYTLIIWFTFRWHALPKWRYAVPLGLLVGLAALIRPTEIIAAIIPLAWGIYGRDSWGRKVNLVSNHWKQVVAMVLLTFLVGSLQLIYWKLHAGTWIYYSYEEGETLRMFAPYIMFVLFSWKKGWLIYAPMMAFPLIGFIMLYRQRKKIFWAALLFFALSLLIVSSWTTWWFGGSLGQRALMQSYAVLALPFGAFITWILRRSKWIKALFLLIALFFIWLNLFQTWQYMTWIIDPSRMTKAYYMAIFGRTEVDPAARNLLEVVESSDREYLDDGKSYAKREIASHTFDWPGAETDPSLAASPVYSGFRSLRMDAAREFSTGIKTAFRNLGAADGAWLRVSLLVFRPDSLPVTADLVITMQHGDKSYKYKAIDLEKEAITPGEWSAIGMDYQIPHIEDEEDLIAIYVWNRGKALFYIDDIRIDLLEPR